MATKDGAKFLKCRRQMSLVHKKLWLISVKSRVNYRKELTGGYDNVSAVSCLVILRMCYEKLYIGCYDAQMVIKKFQNKKQVCLAYFFECFVEEGVLTRIFWAVPVSVRNYGPFSDVVSFDATYSLNK